MSFGVGSETTAKTETASAPSLSHFPVKLHANTALAERYQIKLARWADADGISIRGGFCPRAPQNMNPSPASVE